MRLQAIISGLNRRRLNDSDREKIKKFLSEIIYPAEFQLLEYLSYTNSDTNISPPKKDARGKFLYLDVRLADPALAMSYLTGNRYCIKLSRIKQ